VGRYKESLLEFQKSQLLSGFDPDEVAREVAARLEAFNKGGEKGFWLYVLNEMLQAEKRGQPQKPAATDIATAYAMAGDKDKAFEWLNRAYEWREGQEITLLKCEPYFKNLRGDPRFTALLQRMGIQPV
jgi:hypothetical protein